MITFDPTAILEHDWTRDDVAALTEEDLTQLTDHQLDQLAACGVITGYWNWGRPGWHWTIVPADIQAPNDGPRPIPTTGPFNGQPF